MSRPARSGRKASATKTAEKKVAEKTVEKAVVEETAVEETPVAEAPVVEAEAVVETVAVEAEKAPEAKKTTVKKATAKKTTSKENIVVQWFGKEVTTDSIVKSVKEIWTKQMKNKVSDIKSLTIYVKPEENTAYYVINEEVSGSIEV